MSNFENPALDLKKRNIITRSAPPSQFRGVTFMLLGAKWRRGHVATIMLRNIKSDKIW
jgi:hypothetical protein